MGMGGNGNVESHSRTSLACCRGSLTPIDIIIDRSINHIILTIDLSL